jgi:hypothetical protein
MASELIWHCDEHGVANLVGPNNETLWINKRQAYCDRGHWELGAVGFYSTPQPSRYFHRVATAQREAELWLARSLGRPAAEGDVSCPVGWDEIEPTIWQRVVEGPQGPVVCQLERSGDETNPVWGWTIPEGLNKPPDQLDGSDAFPRHFLRAEHAVAEVEDFLMWRLDKVPAETPGFQERPDEPVTGAVRDLIQAGQAPKPRARKP